MKSDDVGVEEIVNRGVYRCEALGMSLGFEALHLSFSSSYGEKILDVPQI